MKSVRKSVQSSKNQVRKMAPSWLAKFMTWLYRNVRAFFAALVFGFPGKRLKVIGVTGTNGKTTTSAYIGSILEAAGHKIAISSTAIYQIGDKKWLNETNFTNDYAFQQQKFLFKCWLKRVDYVILEVTAHGLQQKRGAWGINYVAAIMTNLTQDHLDYFQDMDNYAAAKSKLFAKSPPVIALNQDDDWYDYYNKFEAGQYKLSYGTHKAADIRIASANLSGGGTAFNLNIDKSNPLELESQLVGKFNVYNATAAAAVTYGLHIPLEDIKTGIGNLESVPGRMQTVDEGQDFGVIVDYAHTPDALANVLETVQALTTKRVILVFGATGDRDKDKRSGMGKIAGSLADRVYLTEEEDYSEEGEKIRAGVMKGIREIKKVGITREIKKRDKAIESAIKLAKKGDTVLITGMGHLTHMTTNDGKVAWSDVDTAREMLLKKLKK